MRLPDLEFRTHLLAAGLISALGVFSTDAEALPVTSGLQLWFDATDDATVFDANGLNPNQAGFLGTVAQWLDKSPNAVVATSSEVTDPKFDPTGLNGQPTIFFEGGFDDADNRLPVHAFSLDQTITTSDETIFVVTTQQVQTRAHGPWLGNSTPNLGHGVPGALLNDGDRYFVSTSDGIFGFVDNSRPTEDTVLMETRLGGSVNIEENGILAASFVAPGSLSVNTIGQFPFGPRFFRGEISEILLYDRALTVKEQNDVGFFLEEKYNIETTYNDGTPPEDTVVTLFEITGKEILEQFPDIFPNQAPIVLNDSIIFEADSSEAGRILLNLPLPNIIGQAGPENLSVNVNMTRLSEDWDPSVVLSDGNFVAGLMIIDGGTGEGDGVTGSQDGVAASRNRIELFTTTSFPEIGKEIDIELLIILDDFEALVEGSFLDGSGSFTADFDKSGDISFIVLTDNDQGERYQINCLRISTADDSLPCSNTTGVPEPATLSLLASGLAVMGFMGWRRRKSG